MSSKLTWIATAFLVVVFFLHGHDFAMATKLGVEGYYSADRVASFVELGSPQRSLAMLALGVFGGALLLHRKGARLGINRPLGNMIVFFLLWALASIAWTDDVALTSRRLILLAILWLSALGVAARLSLRRIICVAFLVSTMFLLVGVCAELLLGTFHPFQAGVQYAGLDTGYRFSGTNDPNVGAWELSTMLLSAVFLFINARRYRALLCAAGFGAFFFLILSKTRTSVAAISVCLIACRVLVTHWKITLVVMLVAALFIGGLYLTLDNTLLSIAQRTILLGREDSAATTSTLTGRIPLWTELISVDIPKHPLAGYGYGAFWTPSLIIKLPTNGSTALNGYIDVTLELGMVGAAAYVLMLVLGAIKSVRLYKRSGNSDYLFIFAMIVFHLITMVNDSVNVACFPTFITLSLLAKLGFDKSYALQQYPQVHSVWPQGISRTVRGRYQHGGSVSTEGV